ncbi:PLD nuclease N-terminal domain-containing protein [Streptomyces qinglanensis]|uniref:Phospholipase_D-nuclease N-terminal n=1 Tax=Streptomyces qinglanensis TaxID=943816 RepID=A0A1H9WTU6_9ACTN|nr:PLD nuclease N-terminal domain-containing protein [Streptomyces qinglanensis]SES37199.1 Phospholipase_D-nuclease N-terminal [Streptomyces qinglanensis]
MLRYLPFLLILAVWIYAFIDCLNTPENEVRKLPKVAWVIIILLFGQVLLGPVAWFAVGRPRRNAPYGATRPDERRWVAPDDNPDFLKSLNESPAPGTHASTDAPPAPEPAPEPAPDPAPEQRRESPRDEDELPNRKDRDDG